MFFVEPAKREETFNLLQADNIGEVLLVVCSRTACKLSLRGIEKIEQLRFVYRKVTELRVLNEALSRHVSRKGLAKLVSEIKVVEVESTDCVCHLFSLEPDGYGSSYLPRVITQHCFLYGVIEFIMTDLFGIVQLLLSTFSSHRWLPVELPPLGGNLVTQCCGINDVPK